jgi:hypothetical protein
MDPEGVTECSRGWSEAEPPVAKPQRDFDPEGVEETGTLTCLLDPFGVES